MVLDLLELRRFRARCPAVVMLEDAPVLLAAAGALGATEPCEGRALLADEEDIMSSARAWPSLSPCQTGEVGELEAGAAVRGTAAPSSVPV